MTKLYIAVLSVLTLLTLGIGVLAFTDTPSTPTQQSSAPKSSLF